ncbi:MAG TPA: FeoA family protein [Opitutaceae bacterium]|nr:FeoA family protein [Opitutaceae bacterium]
MAAVVKLSELPIGSSATVRDFSKAGNASLRLREMGLIVGTNLTLIRTAPMGDPIEIKIRGYHLTLRKAEAEHVLVEPAA